MWQPLRHPKDPVRAALPRPRPTIGKRHEMVLTELGGTPGLPGLSPNLGLLAWGSPQLCPWPPLCLPSQVPSLVSMQPRPAEVGFFVRPRVLAVCDDFPCSSGDRRPRELPPLQMPSPHSFTANAWRCRVQLDRGIRVSAALLPVYEERGTWPAAVGFPSAAPHSPTSRLQAGR